ncbi:MAG: ABC transporter permease [Planctomycetota bacterium]|nr:ABC transporter permease [Planctomycetota bacterium]
MSNRLEEIRELTRVRTLLFLREPEALFWVFVFPLILAAVLGFAFRDTGAAESRVAVLAASESDKAAAELVATLEGVEHLEVELVTNREEALLGLRNGSYDVIVHPGEPPTLRLDPTRPPSEAAKLRIELALRAGGDPQDGERESLYVVEEVKEKGARYVDFLFPGLLGLNLMGTGMWSVGFAVADMRQRKVLKRMLVTPMRRSSFLLSFFLSRLAFFLLEVIVLVAFGVWVLGVPFRTGLGGFLALCVVGAFIFSGLGLLTTARAKTIEGASGLMNFVMMPMWLASGVFFSYERFPDAIQPLLRVLPLSALNDALRAMMLDGEGLAGIWTELAIQLAWGGIAFFLALRIFRWE